MRCKSKTGIVISYNKMYIVYGMYIYAHEYDHRVFDCFGVIFYLFRSVGF